MIQTIQSLLKHALLLVVFILVGCKGGGFPVNGSIDCNEAIKMNGDVNASNFKVKLDPAVQAACADELKEFVDEIPVTPEAPTTPQDEKTYEEANSCIAPSKTNVSCFDSLANYFPNTEAFVFSGVQDFHTPIITQLVDGLGDAGKKVFSQITLVEDKINAFTTDMGYKSALSTLGAAIHEDHLVVGLGFNDKTSLEDLSATLVPGAMAMLPDMKFSVLTATKSKLKNNEVLLIDVSVETNSETKSLLSCTVATDALVCVQTEYVQSYLNQMDKAVLGESELYQKVIAGRCAALKGYLPLATVMKYTNTQQNKTAKPSADINHEEVAIAENGEVAEILGDFTAQPPQEQLPILEQDPLFAALVEDSNDGIKSESLVDEFNETATSIGMPQLTEAIYAIEFGIDVLQAEKEEQAYMGAMVALWTKKADGKMAWAARIQLDINELILKILSKEI